MRFSIYAGEQDISDYVRIAGFSISGESGGRMSQCSFSVINFNGLLDDVVIPGAEVVVLTRISPPGTQFDESLFDDAVFGGGTAQTGEAYFRGHISSIVPERQRADCVLLQVGCADFTSILDTTIIDLELYLNEQDNAVITDLFSTYLPSVSVSGIGAVAVIPSLKLQNTSLRKAMEMICELTGAEWSLSADRALRYDVPGSAEVFLSDTADEQSSFSYNIRTCKYAQDFRAPCNSITVLGEVTSAGARFTGSAEDTTSQSTYGRVFHRVLVDRTIKSNAQAALRAQAEVAKLAWPEETASCEFFYDGVRVGTNVRWKNDSLGVDSTFLVRKLVLTQKSPTVTLYRADFGAVRPDGIAYLRKLAEAAGTAETPIAVPAPASVGNSSLDRTSGDKVSINTGDIANAAVSATKIGNLAVKSQHIDTAAVTSEKIENAAITAEKIGNAAVKAVNIDNLAVTTEKINNLAVTTAKIENAAITAEKIGNLAVTAEKIANLTVTAGKIANLTITAGQIADLTITGGKIANATITSAKISDLSVAKLTGWEGAAINVGSPGMEFSGGGGIVLNYPCHLIVEGLSSFYDGIQIIDSNLQVSGGGVVASEGITCSGASGYFNAGSGSIGYQVNGTTVINGSRNGSFAGLKCTGNFEPAPNVEAIALSGITTAGWFGVYSGATFLGKCPYFL